ncbi:hypothetical protein CAPTEDRAFT_59354, partial [Capitella teleta]
FSEIAKLIRMFLTMPITTANAERSFSTLRRLKTYLRSTMRQDCLNDVMLVNVHKHRSDDIDMGAIAEDFIS